MSVLIIGDNFYLKGVADPRFTHTFEDTRSSASPSSSVDSNFC
jgi:hypothetical protein